MHDHPWQTSAIMGGAFGGTRGSIRDMAGKIKAWTQVGFYGADQQFLSEIIYPAVKETALRHDSWVEEYGGLLRPFPTALEDFRFVGERIEPDGHPFAEDRRALIEAVARREARERANWDEARVVKEREAVTL
jgi:hypothetical protein